MQKGLTFDDIMMVPAYTEVESRIQCSSKVSLWGKELAHPILPANMDTISGGDMLNVFYESGGMCFPHRFMDLKDQFNIVRNMVLYWNSVNRHWPVIPFTLGVKEDIAKVEEHLLNYGVGINCVLLDVAHANSKQVVDRIKEIRCFYDGYLIAGNVATYDGVKRLIDAEVNGVKVGIGNGSICSTRLVTGHGIPQVTALQEADRARALAGLDYEDFVIISDGGCNHYGDVVKALGLGANLVMSGRLFAGCTETPGEMINNSQGVPSKIYRGMASWEAQNERDFNTKTAEGVSQIVPIKGSARGIIDDIKGAIRSGLSYSGVKTIRDFYEQAEFITQTSNGLAESQTRR